MLHDVADYTGKTMQAYLHDAALEAMSKTMAEIRADEDYLKRHKKLRSQSSQGLGLREKLEERHAERETVSDDPEENEFTPTAPQPTPPPQDQGDSLGHMAKYIVTGPEWSRASRTQDAIKILAASTNDSAERLRLAAALDAQVALLDGKKPSDPGLIERVKKGLGL